MSSIPEQVARVLAEHGASEPGSSHHGWRCEYPDRYGPCTCTADLVTDIVAALGEPSPIVAQGINDIPAGSMLDEAAGEKVDALRTALTTWLTLALTGGGCNDGDLLALRRWVENGAEGDPPLPQSAESPPGDLDHVERRTLLGKAIAEHMAESSGHSIEHAQAFRKAGEAMAEQVRTWTREAGY